MPNPGAWRHGRQASLLESLCRLLERPISLKIYSPLTQELSVHYIDEWEQSLRRQSI